MSKLSEAKSTVFDGLENKLRNTVSGMNSFEEAAQSFTKLVYNEFSESIILARVFVTIPYKDLPAKRKNFVDELVNSKKVSHLLHDDTPVLSLVGTNGKVTAWNSWMSSKGHIGIPMVSSEFIESIPMMSRLLKQLGLGLDWIDQRDTSIVKNTIGSISGIFYVKDALTELDNAGRKVISAQDFVSAHHIKTVSGLGGGYMGTSTFMTIIIFLNEQLEEQKAKFCMSSLSFFKGITFDLVKKRLLAY
jgi:hypothetical protein